MGVIVGATWTYSGDPSVDNKDLVRFLVGDTNIADQLVSDEEILNTLAIEAHPYLAAATVATSIAGSFARQTGSKKVGDLQLQLQQAQGYHDLAKQLRDLAGRKLTSMAAPYDAALLLSEESSATADTDRDPGQFKIGGFDNPLAPRRAGIVSST